MLKKFGALPFILIALLGGTFMAGKYSGKGNSEAVPGEKTAVAEKTAGTSIIPSFIRSLVNGALPSAPSGTQAEAYQRGFPYGPDMTVGSCLYCHTLLAITGNKGSDSIRCPTCGGKMAAIQAIVYFNYCSKQVH